MLEELRTIAALEVRLIADEGSRAGFRPGRCAPITAASKSVRSDRCARVCGCSLAYVCTLRTSTHHPLQSFRAVRRRLNTMGQVALNPGPAPS